MTRPRRRARCPTCGRRLPLPALEVCCPCLARERIDCGYDPRTGELEEAPELDAELRGWIAAAEADLGEPI